MFAVERMYFVLMQLLTKGFLWAFRAVFSKSQEKIGFALLRNTIGLQQFAVECRK